MDDLDHPPIIDLDDHRSIAVRRKRRSASSLNSHSRNTSASSPSLNHGINTPPATPKRSKKRVRFSDPGPNLLQAESSASSGLTPFIRRASLASTPKSSRRHSTPATISNRSQYHDEAPLSGTLQFAPLRQVLDGRVKRRLRRNRLSEEVNNIEWDKRHEARSRKLEVERLRNELRDKDMEVQSMRDEQDIASQLEGESGSPVTTTSRLSSRISELEQQISELKAELERKENARHDESHWDPDWTMAAKDPFHDGDDEYEHIFRITNYDDDFGDANDELMTTPTRLNTSFPSPPSTLPNTPCIQQVGSSPSRSSHSDAENDAEKDALKSQLQSLQSEIQKLTSAIAFKEDNHSRLTEKLSDYLPQDESHDHSTLDSALDTVLTQLALTQASFQERNAAFNALTSEISTLGFSSSGPEETIQTIAQSFRQARLDLEYLTPGENPIGFENGKLLEMLVSRIKVLLEKVKERDDSIDQYHSQELLLREQLNARVDALLDVQKDLGLATSVVTDLRNEIEENEIGTERLKSALDGYRDEVACLEALISKMETQESTLRSQLSETQERLQDEIHSHETTRTCIQGNDILLSEYSNRLATALQATTTLQQEIHTLERKHQEEKQSLQTLINDRDVSTLEREKKHGEDLALRDVRVNQLRTEMERVNAALHSAHASIMGLRNKNRELEQQVEGEKRRGRFVVQSMRQQLAGVLGIGEGYLNGDVAVRGPEDEPQGQNYDVAMSGNGDGMAGGGNSDGNDGNDGNGNSSPITQQRGRISSSIAPVIRRGFFLDGRLARRRSSGIGKEKEKKRRRYDSGLGFLDEQGEGEEIDGEMIGNDEEMDEIMNEVMGVGV